MAPSGRPKWIHTLEDAVAHYRAVPPAELPADEQLEEATRVFGREIADGADLCALMKEQKFQEISMGQPQGGFFQVYPHFRQSDLERLFAAIRQLRDGHRPARTMGDSEEEPLELDGDLEKRERFSAARPPPPSDEREGGRLEAWVVRAFARGSAVVNTLAEGASGCFLLRRGFRLNGEAVGRAALDAGARVRFVSFARSATGGRFVADIVEYAPMQIHRYARLLRGVGEAAGRLFVDELGALADLPAGDSNVPPGVQFVGGLRFAFGWTRAGVRCSVGLGGFLNYTMEDVVFGGCPWPLTGGRGGVEWQHRFAGGERPNFKPFCDRPFVRVLCRCVEALEGRPADECLQIVGSMQRVRLWGESSGERAAFGSAASSGAGGYTRGHFYDVYVLSSRLDEWIFELRGRPARREVPGPRAVAYLDRLEAAYRHAPAHYSRTYVPPDQPPPPMRILEIIEDPLPASDDEAD
ncbi:hypothetical protein M3Y99_00518600 [Aphelenchoides fujianensis]|nr:hypothetical protein M3Y99_00518600 [Aphelenchoides fujianensis]